MGEAVYYEEKFADGILYCRSMPYDEWHPIDYDTVIKRLIKAEDKLRRIRGLLEGEDDGK